MPFSPKDPAEIINLTFDFSNLLSGISAAVCEIEVTRGTDASASAMLSGVATVNGTKVMQKVINGLAGCEYNVRCKATASDGQLFVLADALPVIHF
jgi:hypothetical protein